jgi:hypothetical protein
MNAASGLAPACARSDLVRDAGDRSWRTWRVVARKSRRPGGEHRAANSTHLASSASTSSVTSTHRRPQMDSGSFAACGGSAIVSGTGRGRSRPQPYPRQPAPSTPYERPKDSKSGERQRQQRVGCPGRRGGRGKLWRRRRA